MPQTPARQLGELGAALLDSGVSVTDVATSLDRAAARNGVARLDFAVLPELIMITEPYSGSTTVVQSPKQELTFRQAASVNRLAGWVEAGKVTLAEVEPRVARIRAVKSLEVV